MNDSTAQTLWGKAITVLTGDRVRLGLAQIHPRLQGGAPFTILVEMVYSSLCTVRAMTSIWRVSSVDDVEMSKSGTRARQHLSATAPRTNGSARMIGKLNY
jgi:hypothetical protein